MKKTTLFIALLLLAQLSAPAISGKVYRWKDEHGNWILSDKVPPEQAKQERSELNKDGRTIKIYEAAKTPEQLEQEAAIERLQKEKERILSEQQQSDQVLLKTFQRDQDIENALLAKLNTLNTRNQLVEDQLIQQRKHLQSLQKKAAGFERDGKPIPGELLEDIQSIQKNISDFGRQLENTAAKKQILIQQADDDAKRLRALKLTSSQGVTVNHSGVPALALGKIRCIAEVCNEVWVSALNYTRQFANTRQIMKSDNLLITGPANTHDDLSISLTRVADDEGATVYMDIRCKDSEAGRALCKNSATLKILREFGPKVAANLAED